MRFTLSPNRVYQRKRHMIISDARKMGKKKITNSTVRPTSISFEIILAKLYFMQSTRNIKYIIVLYEAQKQFCKYYTKVSGSRRNCIITFAYYNLSECKVIYTHTQSVNMYITLYEA